MKVFLQFTFSIICIFVVVFGQRSTPSNPSQRPSPAQPPQNPSQRPSQAQPPQNPSQRPSQAQTPQNSSQRPSQAQTPQNPPQRGPQKPPKIDFGKCPQLRVSKSEETRKVSLQETCLKSHPIPKKLNERSATAHSKLMVECILKQDNWFDSRGRYRFGRTKTRIVSKKLPKQIETELMGQLTKCRSEAEKKFPQKNKTLDMIQLFQACMEFQTAKACEMKLIE